LKTRRVRLAAVAAAVAATVAVTAAGSAAVASEDSRSQLNSVRERLTGYEETPLALSTTGSGMFRAHIDDGNQEITYVLTYTQLEGNVTQAHIHFGAVAQTGGVSAFLCTNLGNGPAGTQVCPAAPGTVTGVIGPADIIGPSGQGIAPGQFDELVAAIRAGTAYVNVHSSLYPVGEIRAQLGHHH
jgi:hypothetical protein